MSKIVKIRNAGSGKYLNIHGSNVTSLTPHQNVTIWEDSGSNEQKWQVDGAMWFSYTGPIRSVVNLSYGLNVYRSGNPYNCDVYPISGNETDSDIVLTTVIGLSAEKIRLKNYNLYLTAASTANGANVYWAAESDSNLQKWYFETVVDDEDDDDTGSGSTTSKSLTMPQNLNQRYYSEPIHTYGCCLCSCCDVGSYYRGTNYTMANMRTYGVYSENDQYCQCNWSNIPSAKFSIRSGYTQSQYYNFIRTRINAGRPVVIHMGTASNGHYVVAYGYINGCTTASDVKVLDPYGENTIKAIGRDTTLADSLRIQSKTEIDHIMLTKSSSDSSDF